MVTTNKTQSKNAPRRAASFQLYLLTSYILIVLIWGFWPFSFRSVNRINWLQNQNGLTIKPFGVVYGPANNQTLNSVPEFGPHNSISIELFIKPDSDSNANFASLLYLFDSDQTEIFSLSQVKSLLNLSITAESESTPKWRWLKNVFIKEQKRLVTICSNSNNTTIYLDGKMAKNYPKYSLLSKRVLAPAWCLVIGNTPSGKNPWKGEIYGLAIYKQFLSARRIHEHFRIWTRKSAKSLLNKKDIIAFYPMNEKKGRIIHNVIDNRFHLFIPYRFKILRQHFFQISRSDFKLKFSTLKDIGINILGFIPLGYLFLSQRVFLKIFRMSLGLCIGLTILCGLCISLFIETLQAYLPVRYSSLSDLIFNALGTGIGALLAAVWMQCKKKLMVNL
jgi:hypothetical protein